MKPVTITYRPLSFLPIYRTVTGSFPQNWGEVSARQLIAIACLYKNRISDIAFISAMSGISKRIINRCDDYERYKLMECLEFVGDQKPYHEFIIPSITLKRQAVWKPILFLYAPAGKLKGITFGQFIFADSYFNNYLESQKDEDLNKFIASLYLRKRDKFKEEWVQCRHKAIGKLDRNTREAIVINWQLMHEWLALAYPLIFQKHQELASTASRSASGEPLPEPVEGEGGSPQRDPNTWIKIFQNFVGDDILHDDVWASKPINTIFQYMTRKYKENAKKH